MCNFRKVTTEELAKLVGREIVDQSRENIGEKRSAKR